MTKVYRKEIDETLDQIDANIEKYDEEKATQLRSLAKKLRTQYEDGVYDDDQLKMMSICNKLLVITTYDRVKNEELEDMGKIINGETEITPTVGSDAGLQEKSEHMLFIRNVTIKSYFNELAKIDTYDTERAAERLQEVTRLYKERSFRAQEIEQEICRITYKLVGKKLADRDETKENIVDFIKGIGLDSDLKIFLRNKIGQIIKNSSKDIELEDIVYLMDRFTRKKEIETTDMSLWEKLAEFDPEIEYERKKITKISENDQEKKDDDLRVLRVRYNSKDMDGINRRDLEKVKKTLAKRPGKYKIEYEEGIRVIPNLRTSYKKINTTKRWRFY